MKKLIIFLSLLILFIPLKVRSLDVSSETAILLDEDSGRVLYGKNIHKQKLIASITKIMTSVLAIESNQLDDLVTINESILESYGSSIYIQLGEEITLRDLVYGLMLRSGNDAAIAISDYLAGSEDNFAKEMNEKASKIGMNNTIFYNSNGLDEKQGNLSTAYDMAILTKYANHLNEYKKIVGSKSYVAKTNYKTYVWANKNKLLSDYKYTTGGKTGFTDKAGRTLVSSATKDNMNLIVVTLNDPNDWTTHKYLYEYGFNNYQNYRVLNKDDFEVDSTYYKNKLLYIKSNYYYPLQISEKEKMAIKIRLEKKNSYNDKDKVGLALVYYKNKLVHEESIYININKKNKEKNIFNKIWSWFRHDE